MLTEIPSFTVVAEGSRSQGSMSFSSQCIILGIIEGNVYQHSQEMLSVGHSGWIRGDITSQGPISISGRIEGNIFSSVKITIHGSARIQGTVVCPKLEIKPGAVVESDILMHWSPTEKSQPPIAA